MSEQQERDALIDAAERAKADEQSLREVEQLLREVEKSNSEVAAQLRVKFGEVLKHVGAEYLQLWTKIRERSS